MKLTCNREKLWNAFQLAAAVAPQRSPKEILPNVKVDAHSDEVTLMATDMEVGIRIRLENVNILTPGKALFPVQQVSAILRESVDDELTIETDEQGILIRGSRSVFKLPSANPDEFPTVAVFDENTYHEIPARLFKEMLRRTVFAADNESSRYALGGVLLEMQDEDVIAVGTDGRRLAKMEGKGVSVGGHRTTGMTTIVPTRAVTLLERAISDKDEKVEVAARSNDLLVRTPRFTIYTRLVEGRYPNWRMVFPKREDAVNIDGLVGQFFAATRQASIVADKDSRGIEFKFGDGSLVLSGRAANIGQSTVDFPISYDGPPITVMMDHRFVGDFFRVLEQDKQFRIEIGAGNEAAVFSTDDGYAYVVMPMAR